jgi:carboxylate-amine ligase
MMVQQNKWRAARFGNQANLVDTDTYRVRPLTRTVERLVEMLTPTAKELGCENFLAHCATMSESPSAAQRQLDLLAETNDPREVVRKLTEESRVTEVGAASRAALQETGRQGDKETRRFG